MIGRLKQDLDDQDHDTFWATSGDWASSPSKVFDPRFIIKLLFFALNPSSHVITFWQLTQQLCKSVAFKSDRPGSGGFRHTLEFCCRKIVGNNFGN
ncbi:hypothetical protein O181_090358 [Austropuccinia psidii MF-1]|uniref:Uncharacterized protein n=1 Tax=Austropuccinia psidii MF-1 TaxID=1389203 RepID=A0A9Q3IUX2_9BASI|nr:hypothetical protein [Austropuccinia psidii MF-1]